MIEVNIKGFDLRFKTNDKIFSPKYIDPGTLAMLSVVDFEKGQKIMDLGCGYGVVGILAAKIVGDHQVFMSDINEDAVQIARGNADLNGVGGVNLYVSNAYENINEAGFDMILSNPPYHVDFSVPKAFIEKGFNRLKLNGKMYMVTKRKDWYKNKLVSIFGGVKIMDINGYYVFLSIKKSAEYAKMKK